MLRTLYFALLPGLIVASSGCDLFVRVTPENAKGVIHVYSSPRCSACRMAKPIVDRLKQQGFNIRVIDIRKNPTKAGKAGVHMIPTFIHYCDGEETDRIVGTASEAELKRMFRP